MSIDLLLLSVLNGISFGFILFLVASGLSLIMGVMGIFNLAHGALYMVGAYVGWTVAVDRGMNFVLAALAGGLAAGLLGLVVERLFFRRLYRQPNEQVLLSFGLLFILANAVQAIWGPLGRTPFDVPELRGSVVLAGLSYPMTRFMIVAAGIVIAVGLWYLQERTRIGAIVRAGMDDKEMVKGLGINLDRVSVGVFFLGAALAGMTGVIGGTVLGANTGLAGSVLLLSMVVVVVGGVGSVQGALIGGLIIGLLDAFGRVILPDLAMFTAYLAMIAILLVRPAGLRGRVV